MFIKQISLILITFILAICLSILPMPAWANWLRPAWIILVLSYWIITYPDYINIGCAWILGLLLDALYGTILGEHALALTVVAYLVYRARQELKRYPLMQQSAFIIFCGFVYNFILFIIQWALGQGMNDWRYWISPLLSILLWPIIATFFRNIRFKFRIL